MPEPGKAPPDPPRLPHTWRPRGGPVVAVVVGVAVTLAMGGMWVAMPDEVRTDFSWPQVVTLLGFGLLLLAGLFGVVRTRLDADDGGLTVVNFYRERRLEWAQVVGVTFGQGDPWAALELDDGTKVSVMALQSADGRRGRVAAAQVARLVAERTRTDRND